MTIQEKLRELQEQRGLTTAELADRANLPVDTINKIRSGTTRSPNTDTVLRLAAALGVTTDELLGNDPLAAEPKDGNVTPQLFIASLRAMAERYDRRLDEANRESRHWRRITTAMLVFGSVILLTIIALLVIIYWDLSHPTMGNIIYDASHGLLG